MSDGASNEWGRVAEDGTVYLRTPDGEREIGSWQAGTAEEGLEFFARKYAALDTEISLLERRIQEGGDPKSVVASVAQVRESLPTAHAIGDMAALERRLDAIIEKADARVAAQREERAQAAVKAADTKRGLVEEAERLSASTDWKATGERYRAIVEEWKGIRGVDRKTDAELWERFSAARKEFDHRRRVHFAHVDEQRKESASVKERLVVEAEKLADSTDWTPTARRFKDLMAEWKAAGRAGREVDDALWARFKAAQDGFFARRSEQFAARDAEQQQNLEAKRALLAEAEGLDATADPTGAERRLRHLQEKWEQVGHVPRDAMQDLERRFGAAEDRIRRAVSGHRPVTVTESPLVVRLRESIEKLEHRIERARAAGDDNAVAEAEQSLATQREWLAQAEQSGG